MKKLSLFFYPRRDSATGLCVKNIASCYACSPFFEVFRRMTSRASINEGY